jgi:hypothetical protein
MNKRRHHDAMSQPGNMQDFRSVPEKSVTVEKIASREKLFPCLEVRP